MDEANPLPGFDKAERARIVRALRRYMEENSIGTPTLKERITDADKPRRRVIPLSTLQRFIGGPHQTQEHHVALCYEFAKGLPYFREDHVAALIGRPLFEFLTAQINADDREKVIREIETRLVGTYEYRAYFSAEARQLPYPPKMNSGGTLTLAQLDRQPYLYAQEVLSEVGPPGRRRHSEGAMILVEPYTYMLMRDSLTRAPKMYVMARRKVSEDDTVLEGSFLESRLICVNPESDSLHHPSHVQLVPVRAEENA